MKSKLLAAVCVLIVFSALRAESKDSLEFGLAEIFEPGSITSDEDSKIVELEDIRKNDWDDKDTSVQFEEIMFPEENSVSYFAQKLSLDIAQMAKAKLLSDESQKMRDSFLHSIYTLRKQAADYERKEINQFKSILNAKQLVKFEELMDEYNKRRVEMGALPINIIEKYQDQMERVDASFNNRLDEYEAKKKRESEMDNEDDYISKMQVRDEMRQRAFEMIGKFDFVEGSDETGYDINFSFDYVPSWNL